MPVSSWMKRKGDFSQASNKVAKVVAVSVTRPYKKATKENKFFQKVDSGPEQKVYDFPNTGTVGDNVGRTQNLLNNIPQGTNVGERVGLNIVVRSIMIHGDFANTAAKLAALGDTESVRMCIFVDKQANGNSISTPQNTVYSTGGTQVSAFTGRDPAYLDRFDVLWMDELNICSLGPNACRYDKYIKCAIPVRYAGSAASTPLTNAIYVGFTGTGAVANAGTARFNVRIQYTDE